MPEPLQPLPTRPSPFNVTENEFYDCVAELAGAFGRGELIKTEAQGNQLHFLIGSCRVRVDVTEVTHDPMGVQAPPHRDTSLVRKRELQLLLGQLANLSRCLGKRLPINLCLDGLDEKTMQQLRLLIGQAVTALHASASDHDGWSQRAAQTRPRRAPPATHGEGSVKDISDSS